MIASLEYAVQVLNTPLIMVLGHEACGAVDATIKSVKDGTTLPGHLMSLVNALKPAVDAAKNDSGDMLANAIKRNVALNVDRLKTTAPILKSFADDKKIRVVGGVYALKNRQGGNGRLTAVSQARTPTRRVHSAAVSSSIGARTASGGACSSCAR